MYNILMFQRFVKRRTMFVKIVQFVIIIIYCSAFKILLVFPIPYRSHAILGEGIVRHLLKAGHEVTYITPYAIPSHKNLTQIELQTNGYLDNAVTVKNVLGKEINTAALFNVLMKIAHLTLSNENVVNLLNDKKLKFDVAVIERMFLDVYCGIAAVFDCPYISFFPYHDDINIFEVIHEMPNPAYTANVGTGNIPPLSFYERVKELLFQISFATWKKYYITPKEVEFYQDVFKPYIQRRGRDLPNYDDMKHNASLALSTSHATIGNVYLQPSSLILIGGFHIKNVIEPLPKNLEKIMDTSDEGVILFSMGSQLTSQGMPKEMKSNILRVFSNLNYTVIWKATEQDENIPENVRIASWLPQQSVLAHPKCVLFITHGGILSITEAVHFGVPIIGIPIFGDQFVNVRTAVKNGFAKEVELSVNLGDKLEEAINEVLREPRYRERAKEMSRIYHTRVAPPGVELVHWIQEVVTSQGAPHLRSPALSMPLFQKYYLDLVASILILLIVLLYLLRSIFYCFLRAITQIKKKID